MGTSDKGAGVLLGVAYLFAFLAMVLAGVAHSRVSLLQRELEMRHGRDEARLQALDRRTRDNIDLSLRCCTR